MARNGLMRGMTGLLGGVAIGMIGSRLLPPLIAQGYGTARARFRGDPFDHLIREHRRISSLLDQMEDAAHAPVRQRGKLFLALKRTITRHAMAEEDAVYPLLYDEIGDHEGSKELYDEHADIKIHLFELEQLLMKDEDWSDRIRSLRRIVDDHIREEEQVHFPKLRRALDDRHTRQLSGAIYREESMVL